MLLFKFTDLLQWSLFHVFQVLSSKLMPTHHRDGGANARMFKENFLASGGLRYSFFLTLCDSCQEVAVKVCLAW